jgi:hypothetical protein
MIRWTAEPSEKHYRAAASYLQLRLSGSEVGDVVARLRAAPVQKLQAKDLIRASGLDAVPPSDPRVAKKVKKIGAGRRLAPVLLIRGMLGENRPLVVADGFHRICAAKATKSGAKVACKLVDLQDGAETDAMSAGTGVNDHGPHLHLSSR